MVKNSYFNYNRPFLKQNRNLFKVFSHPYCIWIEEREFGGNDSNFTSDKNIANYLSKKSTYAIKNP
jgi:hypothetical protein